MTALRYTAYAMFAIAILVAVIALANEAAMLLSGTIWAGLMGMFMLAADRALTYLKEIRDQLAKMPPQAVEQVTPASPPPAKPAPTMEEFEKRMEAMQMRVGKS